MKKRRGILWCCVLLVMALLVGMAGCKGSGSSDETQAGLTWQAQYDLGIRLLNEGKYEDAILAFQAAIQIDPKNAGAYLGLAEVYMAMDNGQAALDILDQGWDAVDEKDREALDQKKEEVKDRYPNLDDGFGEGEGYAGDDDPDSQAVITEMEEVITAQFDYAGPFSEGLACVGYLQEDGAMKYGYINVQGQLVSGLYDYAADFHEGLAAVGMRAEVAEDAWYAWYDCYRYGYINAQGEEVIPLQYLMDDEYQGALSFYEGVAEVSWFSDENEYYVATTLIDKEGNKVLPADILIRDERGYGWNPPDDPRQLTLIDRTDIWDYAQWNPIQKARYRSQTGLSVRGYDGVSTYWMDETFTVMKSMPGYVTELSGMEDRYLSYSSPVGWEAVGDVVDADGNVILAGVSSCQVLHGKYLYVSFYTQKEEHGLMSGSYTYGLFDKNGQAMEMPCDTLVQMEDGYLGTDNDADENNVRTHSVLDLQWNEVFSVRGTGLSRESYYEYVNGTYVYHELPLYRMDYFDPDSGMYGHTYLDLTGQEILPRQSGANINILEGRYLVSNAQDRVTVYTLDGQEILVMEGVSSLYSASMTNVDNAYMAQTFDGQYRYYVGEGTADSLELTEIEAYYHPQTDLLVMAGTEESVLMSGTSSALWGSETEWELPVTLKQGEIAVAQAPGLSLIGNNLYKKADTIIWNEMNYSYDVQDVSLHTVDDGWSSRTYQQMGHLSENYISFCENGKWGYLHVTAQ